ncbi:hypothetical protein HRG_004465 [Hirsutella rhossiliensis]|uniref:Uncharacterized protein n=1 Tax=Hirsutella rhossiliensis TaxID=111463 RepID=A0A9P8MZ90_9HYPO|nr:uncharacterized protein HRG_04465 [Hirsutella rhossiliensis]KAH0964037.1 hypothetical protein HRG_04465 [Hirsutella rhossiliensis]
MPPFIDQLQFYEALRNQANPAIEALAANDHARDRSLRRFERDDPPAYVSSTDTEELDDAFPMPPPGGPLPQDVKDIMDPPITDDELQSIAFNLQEILRPAKFYYTECKFEGARLECYDHLNPMLTGKDGNRRIGVLARRNVKRRWERLGVWNPRWGFPGRNVQPNDSVGTWKWRWQEDDPDGSSANGRQLVARALRLRQNLRRGESVPVPPRSCLEPDATASQAESFLISRPWFTFQIELGEEHARYDRLSMMQERRYPRIVRKQVVGWWRERGDWRDEFNDGLWVTSWKWRHESPSPEPEDLTHFTPSDHLKDSPLKLRDFNPLETMDFTPSETDALEAIELPSPEQPEKFWAVWRGDWPPFFPGQMLDPTGASASASDEMGWSGLGTMNNRHHRPDAVPESQP